MQEEHKGIPEKILDNIYHTKGDIDLSDWVKVKGYDFNKGLDYEQIFKSLGAVGAQSTALAKSMEIINDMITWRLSDEPIEEEEDEDY